MESTSARFKFDTVDLKKTIRHGAVVVISYVALTILSSLSSDISSGNIDLGHLSMFQGLILSGLGMALEAIRRWLTDHSA